MKIRPGHNSDGIALIIALIAILVLSALAAGFALSMKVETRLAFNANSETQFYWLGRSGVELARWVLAQEKCPYDSLNQIWAGGPGSDCETNGPLAGFSLNNYPIGDGTVSIKIIDLERKANINTANSLEIQQALTLMGVDANDISVVADSIQDWIGPAGPPRVAGAESDYYQGLDPPYYAKNAPIDDISELLLVRGILDHPEIYWGGCATNRPGPTFQHKLGFGNSPERESVLSVRVEGRFHAHFQRTHQHQHRRRERPANDSRRGRRHSRKHHQIARRSRRRGRHGGRHAIPEPRGGTSKCRG